MYVFVFFRLCDLFMFSFCPPLFLFAIYIELSWCAKANKNVFVWLVLHLSLVCFVFNLWLRTSRRDGRAMENFVVIEGQGQAKPCTGGIAGQARAGKGRQAEKNGVWHEAIQVRLSDLLKWT